MDAVREAEEFLSDTPTPVKPEYKMYNVRVRFQYPAWDEKDGMTYEVEARSKSDAVRQARNQVSDEGHSHKGLMWFTATVAED